MNARGMMERTRLVLCRSIVPVLLLACLVGHGAPAAGESVFSSLGLGESSRPTTARGTALGGSGIALADSVSGSFLNPASASLLRRLTISVVFSPELRYPDGLRGASKNWSSRLDAVEVILPFPRSVALSAGLLLWGDMNSSAEWSGETSSEEFLGRYEREGGVFSFPCHLSVGFRNRLFVAGGADVVQINSREIWEKDFHSADYQDSRDVLDGSFSGARPSFSILLRWPEKLTLGFILQGAADLDGSLTTEPMFGKEFKNDSSLHLPASYGAGLSFHPVPGWMFVIEGSRVSWGDLRIADSSPLPDRLSRGFAVGLEKTSTRRAGTWVSRLPLRIGYRHESQPFDWPEGETVLSQMITLGTGFSLTEKTSRLDLAVAVGRIGDVSKNGVEERVIRLRVSFTASERWQRKRQTHY